jgi:hypothetical protein
VSCVSEALILENLFEAVEANDRSGFSARISPIVFKERKTLPWPSQKFVFAILNVFSQHISTLDHTYEGMCNDNAPTDLLMQLCFLRFCHGSLNQFSRFLDLVQLYYSAFREKISDPRRAGITPSRLEEITRDAYFYEQLMSYQCDITQATEALLEISAVRLKTEPYQLLAAELRATCADLNRTTSRLSSRLEDHLKFIEIRRSVSESSTLWLLSVLASIFLPLSLATGILSMQTRLTNLHYLLYDFCGLLVFF